MALKNKDFIEVEFTAKNKETGEIFDSNRKEDLKKMGSKAEAKPFVFCLGEGMFLKGIEDYLINKDLGNYTIELSPENAFGKRDPTQIQMMPMKVFQDQDVQPFPGAMYNFDGKIAKVLTVSGGRVMVDFNNPLAGKDVIYEVKINRKIDDLNEKVKSLNEFLFRQQFPFGIKEKKIIMQVDKKMLNFVELFKDKFKKILGLELQVVERNDIGQKESNKKEKKSNLNIDNKSLNKTQ